MAISKHSSHLWTANSQDQCGIFREYTKNIEWLLKHSQLSNELWFSLSIIRFRITYRLILREKELHFHIGVFNPSKDVTFSFNLLLHTYLKVPDVRRCQITGLHGCTFIDKVHKMKIHFLLPSNCFLINSCFVDTWWSNLSRRKRCCHSKWMDRSNLSAYTARAHHHQCCIWAKNEIAKI